MTGEKMISTYRSPNSFRTMLVLAALGVALSGCIAQSAQAPRLRITNIGEYAINNLTLIFPQERIKFGDIPAGITTEYQDVPNGVFRYAAYELEIDGEVISQPVIDWVGESPVEGNTFTYTIDFDPGRAETGEIIRLVDLTRDD